MPTWLFIRLAMCCFPASNKAQYIFYIFFMKVRKWSTLGLLAEIQNCRSIPSSITKIWIFWVQHYFPTNCFWFTGLSLEPEKLKTVVIFAIPQLVLKLLAKKEFLFIQCDNIVHYFFRLVIVKNMLKIFYRSRHCFAWNAEAQVIFNIIVIKLTVLLGCQVGKALTYFTFLAGTKG